MTLGQVERKSNVWRELGRFIFGSVVLSDVNWKWNWNGTGLGMEGSETRCEMSEACTIIECAGCLSVLVQSVFFPCAV